MSFTDQVISGSGICFFIMSIDCCVPQAPFYKYGDFWLGVCHIPEGGSSLIQPNPCHALARVGLGLPYVGNKPTKNRCECNCCIHSLYFCNKVGSTHPFCLTIWNFISTKYCPAMKQKKLGKYLTQIFGFIKGQYLAQIKIQIVKAASTHPIC